MSDLKAGESFVMYAADLKWWVKHPVLKKIFTYIFRRSPYKGTTSLQQFKVVEVYDSSVCVEPLSFELPEDAE